MNLDYNYDYDLDTDTSIHELYNKWELEESEYSKHLKLSKNTRLDIIYLITAYHYNIFLLYNFIIYLYQISGILFIPTPLIGVIKYF